MLLVATERAENSARYICYLDWVNTSDVITPITASSYTSGSAENATCPIKHKAVGHTVDLGLSLCAVHTLPFKSHAQPWLENKTHKTTSTKEYTWDYWPPQRLVLPLPKVLFFLSFFFFLIFKVRSCYIAQAGFKLTTLLLQPPKCWDYRCELPCPASWNLKAPAWMCLGWGGHWSHQEREDRTGWQTENEGSGGCWYPCRSHRAYTLTSGNLVDHKH
jgi:hypothetical protein